MFVAILHFIIASCIYQLNKWEITSLQYWLNLISILFSQWLSMEIISMYYRKSEGEK